MVRPPADLKAILFDLDDTLCEYMRIAIASRREAFEMFRERLPGVTIDAIDSTYTGVFGQMVNESRPGGAWRDRYLEKGEYPRDETMRRLAAALGLPDDGLHMRVSSAYHAIRRRALRLYEDSGPCLEALAAHFRLGLVTNGPADIQRDEIDVLGIADYFGSIRIEGEFRSGKPDPAIFRAAIADLQASSAQAVFVGNSLESDVAGACGAGVLAVWLNREGQARSAGHPVPDVEFSDLYAFCRWLGMPLHPAGHDIDGANRKAEG